MIDWRFLHAGGVSHSIVIDDYCHMCVEYCGFTYKQQRYYIYIYIPRQNNTQHKAEPIQIPVMGIMFIFHLAVYICTLYVYMNSSV